MNTKEINLEPYKNCFAIKNAVYIVQEFKEPTEARPCCFYKGRSLAKTWDEYQKEIQSHDTLTVCSHCIDAEENGAAWSHRLQYENEFYHSERYGKVFVIGVCFDNICNIKCTTCGPTNSSKWIEDYTKLNMWKGKDDRKLIIELSKNGPEKAELIKSYMKDIEFDTLRLDIYGGEPTINPLVIEFIDWLSSLDIAHKLIISFTTNCTVFFEKFEYYLTKFKSLQIQLSIDGIENHFEHLRFLAKWDQVSKNIIQYDRLSNQFSNLIVSIHYTLSWMNALHFPKFYRWVAENTTNLTGLHLTKVMSPMRYCVDLLTPEQKKDILEKVNSEIKVVSLSHLGEKQQNNFTHLYNIYTTSLLNYSSEAYKTDWHKQEAFDMLSSLDTIRKTQFKDTFKEMIYYMENKNEQ